MKPAYRSSRAWTSRILPQRFDLAGATALGGLNHLAAFVRGLGVDRQLAARFRRAKAPWSRWPLDRVLRVLLDAHCAGLERLSHFEDLEAEPLLCAQHRVARLPDLKTLYRDLRRFARPDLSRSLGEMLYDLHVQALARQQRVVLEFDSTVEILHGEQEGAERGPNPKKPGRLSYHPLLVRDRLSDLVLHHVLRPGSAGAITAALPFVHRTLDLVKDSGPKTEILARADAAFDSNAVLAAFERRGAGYVVKMRATPDVAAHVAHLTPQAWRRVEVDGEGEIMATWFFWRRATAWDAPRRVVVLRKRGLDRMQGHLFDALGWAYSFYVTNLDWEAPAIARFYDKRADVERTICELKNDLFIGHVPSASFAANAADLALKILARTLLVLYRDRELKLSVRVRVMTLRRRFLHLAGRLVRRGGRLWLRLTAGSPLHLVLNPHPARL